MSYERLQIFTWSSPYFAAVSDLFEALERAVMALVEPPGVLDRQPHQVHLVEHDPEGPDRPFQHGDIGEVEGELLAP